MRGAMKIHKTNNKVIHNWQVIITTGTTGAIRSVYLKITSISTQLNAITSSTSLQPHKQIKQHNNKHRPQVEVEHRQLQLVKDDNVREL